MTTHGTIPPGFPSHDDCHRELARCADMIAHGYLGYVDRYNFLSRWHREFRCEDGAWGADRRP